MSDKFWDNYEAIKNFEEERLPIPEQSLEQKAINNIRTLLNLNNEEITQFKNFLRTLLEDILDYGTLPDYTMRRITNLEVSEYKIRKIAEELKKLKDELGGDDYLIKEKEKSKTLHREIIIAIENQKEKNINGDN